MHTEYWRKPIGKWPLGSPSKGCNDNIKIILKKRVERIWLTPWSTVLLEKLIVTHLIKKQSRDSSVGIALGYGLDDRGPRVRFPAGAGNFSLHHRVQNGSGAHPFSYPMDTRGSFPGVKRPGHEADHSLPSTAEVKIWGELYLHSRNTPSWRGA
jgi:hypothetical protein